MERDKLGHFVKGHFVPKKWRKKISKSNKGQTAWCKGKHFSPEHIEKIRQSALNMSQEQKDKISKRIKELWTIPKYRKHMSKINIGKVSWNKGKKLSKEHREKLSNAHKGKVRKRKKRIIFDSAGFKYYQIYNPKYKSSIRDKRIFEHRYIMEQYLKRPLNRKEVIHHINGNTLDNRIENLMLFPSQSEHMLYHKKLNQGKSCSNTDRQILEPLTFMAI